MSDPQKLSHFHLKYIRGTKEESIVATSALSLCRITKKVFTSNLFFSKEVYITTRSLKHMYDKRRAQEFDFIIDHLPNIIKFPDRILVGRDHKRGDLYLIKNFEGVEYLCPIELSTGIDKPNYIVTAFRVTRPELYLKNYVLIWSWEGGVLHRTDF